MDWMLHGRHIIRLALVVAAGCSGSAHALTGQSAGGQLPGFQRSPWFGEQILEETTPTGVRMLTKQGDFERYESQDRRSLFLIHTNPANKILHTALVGEMNGLLMALTYGTAEEKSWGTFGGPRAYVGWIQPAVQTVPAAPVAGTIPVRSKEAEGGQALVVDGKPTTLAAVLADPNLKILLTDE